MKKTPWVQGVRFANGKSVLMDVEERSRRGGGSHAPGDAMMGGIGWKAKGVFIGRGQIRSNGEGARDARPQRKPWDSSLAR
jgi:hypothetical protein